MRYPEGSTNTRVALSDHPVLIYSLLGKIRVKIVTSKDALESLDGKSDVRLLSDKEETQFRDMILGLLVSNLPSAESQCDLKIQGIVKED